jgi:outer membrane protein assembly factor BamB
LLAFHLSGCTGNSIKTFPAVIKKSEISNALVSSFKPQKHQLNFFQCNPQRTGSSGVDFKSKELKLKWSYKLSDHTFAYNQSTNVWSRSAATLYCPDFFSHSLVYIGGYDKKLHCLNSDTGEKVWKYTTGGEIVHSPCTGIIDRTPFVWFTSSDRTIYALNAVTGKKIWSTEVLPWTTTALPSTGSSPVILMINNRPVIYFTFHLIDNNPFKRIESGRLYALDALTGSLLWATELSSSPLNSPCVVTPGSQKEGQKDKSLPQQSQKDASTALNTDQQSSTRLAVSDTTGIVWLVDPITGQVIFKHTSDYFIHSDTSYSKETKALFFATRFGIITGLNPFDGKIVFSYRTGHYVDSTPSFYNLDGRNVIFAGSYDRNIYCIDTKLNSSTNGTKTIFAGTDYQKNSRTNKNAPSLLWRFRGEHQFFSSIQSVSINGKPCVIASGFDRKLYILDMLTGELIWSFKHGELLWAYIKRGDAMFSSPGAFYAQGTAKASLIYPAFDGNLYCFE